MDPSLRWDQTILLFLSNVCFSLIVLITLFSSYTLSCVIYELKIGGRAHQLEPKTSAFLASLMYMFHGEALYMVYLFYLLCILCFGCGALERLCGAKFHLSSKKLAIFIFSHSYRFIRIY